MHLGLDNITKLKFTTNFDRCAILNVLNCLTKNFSRCEPMTETTDNFIPYLRLVIYVNNLLGICICVRGVVVPTVAYQTYGCGFAVFFFFFFFFFFHYYYHSAISTLI